MEKIIGKRHSVAKGKRGRLEYLVKWKNFSESENSYVLREDMAEDCDEIIQAFNSTLKASKTGKSSGKGGKKKKKSSDRAGKTPSFLYGPSSKKKKEKEEEEEEDDEEEEEEEEKEKEKEKK